MVGTMPAYAWWQYGVVNTNCGGGTGSLYAGRVVAFCADIKGSDSETGTELSYDNQLETEVYDACGNLVLNNDPPNGFTSPGESYLDGNGSWVGGGPLEIAPVSAQFGNSVCWGTWTETQTFTQYYNDGQWLSVSNSASFTVTFLPVTPPTSAYGDGGGASSRNNPSCGAADPVNCASGNFSESFTDVTAPGRGPALDLTRTYNSLEAGTEGMFGYGWFSPYQSNLVNSDGSVTITEGDGSQVTATSNGSGGFNVPTWTDSTLTQNSNGTWTFVRQGDLSYTYGSNGQLTAITDPSGYTTSLSYNGSGQLSAVTDPAHRSITFSYGSNGLVSSVTDPANQTTSYGYDSSGDLTSVTDPMNRMWQFVYGSGHLLTTMTNPDNESLVNTYNASGQVVKQQDPAGLVTSFSYAGNSFSTAGGSTTITGPHGESTVEDYASGALVQLTKDSGGAESGTWTYEYDPNTLGRTMVTDPDGNTTTMSYDSSGNLLSSTDPEGHTTTYTYNSFNEPLTEVDPIGIETGWAYDSDGNLQSKTVTGAGGSPVLTTSYGYTDGSPGDVTQVTDPAGHVTNYAYDSYGDVASVITHPSSGVSDTTGYVYDVLGRVVCEVEPDEVAAGVACPAAGQPRVADTST
jgi:YD repeat-containing protein